MPAKIWQVFERRVSQPSSFSSSSSSSTSPCHKFSVNRPTRLTKITSYFLEYRTTDDIRDKICILFQDYGVIRPSILFLNPSCEGSEVFQKNIQWLENLTIQADFKFDRYNRDSANKILNCFIQHIYYIFIKDAYKRSSTFVIVCTYIEKKWFYLMNCSKKKKKIVKIPILEDNDKFNTDIRNKGNNRKKKWKNVSRGRYNFLPLFERLGEF